MPKKILLISENDEDQRLLDRTLGPRQFVITQRRLDDNIEKLVLNNGFPLVIADYDLIRERAHIFYDLQKYRSKACLIFYSDNIKSEEAAQILQKGIYTIISRTLLSERIHDAVVGGLENRRAFIEILEMMQELKQANKDLKTEKDNLRKKNQELSFINLLSREISYDLNWDSILTRIIDAGLEEALDYILFGIFYKIGSRWRLSLHAPEGFNLAGGESFKSEIFTRILAENKEKVSKEEVEFQLITIKDADIESRHCSLAGLKILPLRLAGRMLGSVFHVPSGVDPNGKDRGELINTIANILALSLKNAQEYHKLKEAAVTDSLTGVYNRKGLYDLLGMEFQRAKRYAKKLSLVMIDMNGFKNINDSMGHQAGDYVLRELAGVLKGAIRQPDIVTRYGGDEFAVLLPESTKSEAGVIMKRVAKEIKGHTFEWGSGKINTTMSYGISNTDELKEGDSEDALIRLADFRLYASKNS